MQGHIYVGKGEKTKGHFGAYDAGRGVFHDRQNTLVLLQDIDFSRQGVLQLFRRTHQVEGRPNLGWAHITGVWQVMLQDAQQRFVPDNNSWYAGIKPLWVEESTKWKRRCLRGVSVRYINEYPR